MHWLQQTPSSNNTRDYSTHGHPQKANEKIILITSFAVEDGGALSRQSAKQDQELSVAQIMNSLLQNSDLNLKKLKKVGKTTGPFRYDLDQIHGN